MTKVIGKNGITATIIADSVNLFGNRMTTFEIEYPRFILAELNTHRMLSKNSASSRAIPLKRTMELIRENTATPVWWGKNQPGMQAKQELDSDGIGRANKLWNAARDATLQYMEQMDNIGLHKQIGARPGEPWFMMKTVISGTEFANLYHLRKHPDAQPEFHELANVMYEAQQKSIPTTLHYGEWHLPYVNTFKDKKGEIKYSVGSDEISLEDAKKISVSCCAQVSYRKLDESLEKAKDIYDKLIKAEVMHASPFEHIATPMLFVKHSRSSFIEDLPKGISHVDRNYELWSGNLKGFIQLRKLMDNEAVW